MHPQLYHLKLKVAKGLTQSTLVPKTHRSLSETVTYHAYCYGCDDKHTTVLHSIPPPSDYWKIPPLQLYWKSTKISNSTSQLTHQIFPRTTLYRPSVEVYPITHGSLYVTLQTIHV